MKKILVVILLFVNVLCSYTFTSYVDVYFGGENVFFACDGNLFEIICCKTADYSFHLYKRHNISAAESVEYFLGKVWPVLRDYDSDCHILAIYDPAVSIV